MRVIILAMQRIGETMGGTEVNTLSFFKWLKSQKISSLIVAKSFKKVVKTIRPDDSINQILQIATSDPPYLIYQLSNVVWSIFALMKVLQLSKKGRPSIIHAQDVRFGGLVAIVAGKLLRVPVCVYLKGLLISELRAKPKYRNLLTKILLALEIPLDNLVIKKSNLVLCETPREAELLSSLNENVKVIPNAVDQDYLRRVSTNVDIRSRMRQKLSVPSDAIVFGFIGRLVSGKNILTIIEAFRDLKLKRMLPNAYLIITGVGPLEPQIRQFIHDNNLQKKVIPLGYVPHEHIGQVFATIDVLVQPSIGEGCSTSLIEGLASGKPIIASDHPNLKNTLDGAAIYVSLPCTASSLAQAMYSIYNDASVRALLSRIALSRGSRFTVDNLYGELLDSWEQLLPTKVLRKPD